MLLQLKLMLWSELVYTYSKVGEGTAVSEKVVAGGIEVAMEAKAPSCCAGFRQGDRRGHDGEGVDSAGSHTVVPVAEDHNFGGGLTPIGKTASAGKLKARLERVRICHTVPLSVMEIRWGDGQQVTFESSRLLFTCLSI